MAIIILLNILCSLVSGYIGIKKGRPVDGFVLGLLLGLPGFFITLFLLSDLTNKEE